jgi:hypothetical protein
MAQKAMELTLNRVYNCVFLETSHGFRCLVHLLMKVMSRTFKVNLSKATKCDTVHLSASWNTRESDGMLLQSVLSPAPLLDWAPDAGPKPVWADSSQATTAVGHLYKRNIHGCQHAAVLCNIACSISMRPTVKTL